MSNQSDNSKLNYFQSDSQRKKVGRRVLGSTRTVFLLHALVLVASFAAGLGVVSNMGQSRAATTYRISPSGNDGNPCTPSQPCLTMNRGYQVANPGDTVEMAGGIYPQQTINRQGNKTAPARVLFRPVSGASVTVSSMMWLYASNIEINNVKGRFTIDTASANLGSQSTITSNVVLRNIDATGAQSQVKTASNVVLQNIDMGDHSSGSDGMKIVSTNGTGFEPTNIVLDNVRIHDLRRVDLSKHVDCLQISSVKGLVIKNSKFWHCMTQGVFLKEFNGAIDNVLIENNWFGPCTTPSGDSNNTNCTQSLILDDGISNITVRYNSFSSAAGLRTQSGVGTSNMYVYGNLGSRPSCTGTAQVSYAYNVWDIGGSKCHSTDLIATSMGQLGFSSNPSSGPNFDLHINTNSIARNRIPASFSPPDGRVLPNYDFDGHARPAEASYDSGADEYGSSTGSTPPPAPAPAEPPSSPTPSPAPTPPPADIPPVPVSGANPDEPVSIPSELKVEEDGTIVADFTGDGVNEVVKDINQDGKIDPKTEVIQELKKNNDQSMPLAQSSTSDANQALTSPSSFLSTTTGKLTFAGAFASLITAGVGSVFIARHYFHWRFVLPFKWPWDRGGGPGNGPVDMISG